MEIQRQFLSIDRYRISVFSCPCARTVVYLHPGSNDVFAACDGVFTRASESAPPAAPFAIVSIDGLDWNRDLSPWPAQKVFRSGEAFSGEADTYLSTLTNRLLPAVETALDRPPEKRVLAGYSMGGLFALYAMYQTCLFDGFVSMSGSLWYDGFLDYMRAHEPARPVETVYLSLGAAEKATNNPRLFTVEACTMEAAAILSGSGVPVYYQQQPGGHSANVPKRLSDGVWYALSHI